MTNYETDMALFAGAGYFYNRRPVNWIPVPQGAAALTGGLDGRDLKEGFSARAYNYGDQIVISLAGTYVPGNGLLGELKAEGQRVVGISDFLDQGLANQLQARPRWARSAAARGSASTRT